MYLDFFGLEKEPFHIAPDPDFLFPSPSHKEAFATVIYGVQQQKGFVVLTGEVGTGKTTVLRAYLQKLRGSQIQPIFIFDPHLSFDELLEAVMTELGAPPHEGNTQFARLQWLRLYLIDAYSAGRSVVLIIDEAQNMAVETMEQLRVLTNLETTKEKLLQVLLVGQPELDDKLGLHELRQLRQRVAVRAHLRELHDDEALDYVKHRVRLAGGIPENIFTKAALQAIVKHAAGNPRVLNIVCDNVLVNAFGAQQHQVDAAMVRVVLNEMTPKRGQRGRQTAFDWRRLAPLAAAAGIALVAGALSLSMWRSSSPAEASAAATTSVPSASEAAASPAESVAPESVAAVVPEPEKQAFDGRAITLEKLLDRERKMEAAVAAAAKKLEQTAEAAAPVASAAPVAEAAPAPEVAAEVIVASGYIQGVAQPAAAPETAPAADATVTEAPVLDVGVGTPEPTAAAVEAVNIPTPELATPEVVSAAPSPTVDSGLSPQAVATPPLRDLAGVEHVKVERGDTLMELMLRRYGKFVPSMLERVQELNPGITDPNHILAGNTLLLPDLDTAEETAPGETTPATAN